MNPGKAHEVVGRTVEGSAIPGASLVNSGARSYTRTHAEAAFLSAGPFYPVTLRFAHGALCGHDSCQGSELTSARSEEHTSELQSLMRNSYAVFCLKKKN